MKAWLLKLEQPRFHRYLIVPRCSGSHAMLSRVRVGTPGRDDVTNPAERSARSNPETGSKQQPENAREDSTVVELSDTGNHKTQYTCQKWVAHLP